MQRLAGCDTSEQASAVLYGDLALECAVSRLRAMPHLRCRTLLADELMVGESFPDAAKNELLTLLVCFRDQVGVACR